MNQELIIARLILSRKGVLGLSARLTEIPHWFRKLYK